MEMHHHINIFDCTTFCRLETFFVVLTLLFLGQLCGGKFLLNFKHCLGGGGITFTNPLAIGFYC